MRQMFVVTTLALTLVGLLGASQLSQRTTAQASTPTTAEHPLVGTWVVDTISASNTDSPEIAVVTSDGGLAGLGANRVAGGRWQPTSPTVAELTLVSVFDGADGAGYIIVRGPHEVDATGDAWTCECTFTLVSADGTVLDSGVAPASGRRLPLEGVDMAGQPMSVVPIWMSERAATPTP
jgi:hypothetical protein